MDQELLQAISQMMDVKLEPIVTRLDAMQREIEELNGSLAETRSNVNALLEWARECRNIKIPHPKIKCLP